MSIAKPFTFTSNTYAKASEVNADFDTVYAQVNSNISSIAQNATNIENLGTNKANINGSASERFAVANPITSSEAVNKQTMMKSLSNTLDYISGLTITKDSGSPEDTIIVSAGSCYGWFGDPAKLEIILSLSTSVTKQNDVQSASTTYYVYIISDNNDGSNPSIYISTHSTTPTGTTYAKPYRLIGGYTTNSDNEIDTIFSNSNSNLSYDGRWISSELEVRESSSMSIGDYSFDLSNYLPDDGFNYMVHLYIPVTIMNASACTLKIGGEVVLREDGYGNDVQAAKSVVCDVIIDTSREMNVTVEDHNFYRVGITAYRYKRLGNNN